MRGRHLLLLWLSAMVVLGGIAQAAPQPRQPKMTPAMVRGLLAALDDPDNGVVAKALEKLSEEKLQNDPEVQKRLRSFIRGPRLGDLLKDPNEKVGETAAKVLGALGEAAREQAPHLVELLKNPLLAGVAAQALGAMGEAAREQAPRIAGLLKDPDWQVREAAVKALGAMHEIAKEQAPHVIALVNDPNPKVRLEAAGALMEMGEIAKVQAPLLVDLLKESELVGGGAAEVLGAMGEAAREQAPRIADLLTAPDWRVRSAAAVALGGMGEAAKAQAPRLSVLLKDPDWLVRQTAAMALVLMSETGKAPPSIADLLKDPDTDVRTAVAMMLGIRGTVAKKQAYLLVRQLKDPDKEVRRAAAVALGSRGGAVLGEAPYLCDLLKDPDGDVREAAAQALGVMGKVATTRARHLGDLLKDPNRVVQETAAASLESLGAFAQEQAHCLGESLKDPDGDVRAAVAQALGALNEAAKAQTSRLGDLLKDPDVEVRRRAAKALGAKGEAAKEEIPRLGDLLEDPDADVREAAMDALRGMGTAAKEQAPRIVNLLKDSHHSVRFTAGLALGDLGEAAREQGPRIVTLLKDPDTDVRDAAATALGNMGEAAREQIPRIVDLLQDPVVNARRNAVEALGNMGETARQQVPRVADMLKDPDALVRAEAVKALGNMGEASNAYAPRIADMLKDPEWRVRVGAAHTLVAMNQAPADQTSLVEALLEHSTDRLDTSAVEDLTTLAPLSLGPVAAIIAKAGTDPANRPDWLLCAHMAGGGDPQVERTLRWVIGRNSSRLPKELTLDEARETLNTFAALWPHTEKYPVFRDEVAQQIARVANLAGSRWTSEDLGLLALHEKNLKDSYPEKAENLRAATATIERWSAARNFAWTWVGHIGFWVLLLFFYPRSPQVQAIFFWNPWVRTITGFGYVGLLLTWVPFLRRRLLAPFAHQLLADADLERFSAERYFKDSEVLIQPSATREKLLAALPRLRGHVVLEGASGLGKSLFIKYLLRQSTRLAVFLPAERCKDGVLEAIQAKLEGHAKDTAFLQSIIYSGALDIYIDGLNEVTADTRARIVQFVERNFHGNILVATQRMEWTPPATARVHVLQPLSDERVSAFLASREPLLGEKARLRGTEYLEAGERFVRQALSPEQPEELRRAMREVLSNPLDLTVIAQLLSEGHPPDLFHLRQQQYELMARDYREVNLAEFPLREFAEESYKMRLEDRPSLPEDRFGKELLRLESFKVVVRRQWKGPNSQEHREWRFRHDKLQEFFIAQTFLGEGNPRIVEHMDDPRFRGVYFLLAMLLEPDSARHLRDLLVVRAASTRDHSVSDEFVTLLEARRGAEQARLASPPAPTEAARAHPSSLQQRGA